MGVDYHGLQFLRYAAKTKSFGLTATIGRQSVYIREEQIKAIVKPKTAYKHEAYCEALLVDLFGATRVDSFDNSSYESASQITDMNRPLEFEHPQYDTVIDFGTLEHIYNVPQAFKNISNLCREGGQILHILPANNYCGHGFWQFSPELFFSLYSETNGYSDTQVFVADVSQQSLWYEVVKPQGGQRAEVTSGTPVYILCRTIRGTSFSHQSVQQSDYVHVWDQHVTGTGTANSQSSLVSRLKAALGRSAIAHEVYRLVDLYRIRARLRGCASLSARNPHLIKHRISSLV